MLSDQPVSIVIVGVGNADFKVMKLLDSDDAPLYSTKHKRYASRDIVQFVEFNKFNNDPAKLAREVLKEIPKQLL